MLSKRVQIVKSYTQNFGISGSRDIFAVYVDVQFLIISFVHDVNTVAVDFASEIRRLKGMESHNCRQF